jgi:voltage-gated potassium channel
MPDTVEDIQPRVPVRYSVVAIIFLAVYSVQVLGRPRGQTETALNVVSAVTWAVFVLDYLARLGLATHRARWFVRHLLDLAVVALPFPRPLRLLLLFAVLQKAFGGAIRGRVVVYTAASVVLLVYVASLAILDAERGNPRDQITNFGDAVWWAISTVTTVGYGDLAPVTVLGRVIAVMLMIGGISLLGVVTATLASWIVQRVAEEDTANRVATAAQIDLLRDDFRQQSDALHTEIRRLTDAVGALRTPGEIGPD